MKTTRLTFRFFKILEYECFKNGLKLYFDSVKLFEAASFSTALFVLTLSMEEFGKSFMARDISMNLDGGDLKINLKSWKFESYNEDEDLWEEFIKLMFRHHKTKQEYFTHTIINELSLSKYIMHEHLESQKQRSVYVGYRKGNWLIHTPSKVSKTKIKKHFKFMNDALLALSDLAVGQPSHFANHPIVHLLDTSVIRQNFRRIKYLLK